MKHKCTIAASLVALILGFHQAASAQGNFGVGFVFGEPTGISWKVRIFPNNAIDGAFGFSPSDRFRMHVDYLWETHPFTERNAHLYYGLGGAVGFGRTEYVRSGRFLIFTDSGDGDFGIRVPVGVDYFIPKSPVEIFLEVSPVLVLTPTSGLGIDGGIGARFYL